MKSYKKKRIVFIYEGISAEEKLLHNMYQTFLEEFYEVDIFRLPADGNIYMLWKRLVDDEFETDVLAVLKEMSAEARDRIEEKKLKASEISEIYLFFDYDGHAAKFSEETIHEANELCKKHGMQEIKNKRDLLERMLCIFSNETEEGKLFVSYPMIEAIKEIDAQSASYKKLYIPLADIDKYKHSFQEKSDYADYSALDKRMWYAACLASIKQASLITRFCEQCTYNEFINNIKQYDIYQAEKNYYINNADERLLAVLNSVPLFLIEYFEETFWNEVYDTNRALPAG